MTSTGDYPLGAKEDPRAPYNQPPDVEVRVCVSATYHSHQKVTVPHEYTDADLREAVRNQITLPGDFSKVWIEDEMEVVLE